MTQETNDLARSLEHLQRGLEVLTDPYKYLTLADPHGPLCDALLPVLLDVRSRFPVDEAQAMPQAVAASRFAEKLCGPNRRGSLEDTINILLGNLDLTIARALEQGYTDPRILRT